MMPFSTSKCVISGDRTRIQLAQTIKADPSLGNTRLVMLTSVGQYGDMEAAKEAGIAVYLNKPVRQSDLYDCLISVMGVSVDRSIRTTAQDMPEQIQAHILLAEDNPVNQEVALSMLDLLGCQVDVANNGREAVEATAKTSYDIVLMDCQMPELDGFEATTAIRDREALASGTLRAHLPIIALTANAMQGDRERCLTAGMDDYLSKPFSQEKLRAVLVHWCPQTPESEGQEQESPSLQSSLRHTQNASTGQQPLPFRMADLDSKALDELRALEHNGTTGIVAKIIQRYLGHTPTLIQALQQAVAAADASGLQQAAHSLKSSSAQVGATDLAGLSQDLEIMGREQQIDAAPGVLADLEAEYAAVQAALTAEIEAAPVPPEALAA